VTGTTTFATTATPEIALQSAIHILYQDTDQAVLAAASRVRTPSASTVSADANDTPVSPIQPAPGSITDGTKAGIGVGVAIALLSIFAGLMWFFRRRQSQRQLDNTHGSGDSDGVGELHGEEVKRSELEAPHGEAEAAATLSPLELEGDRW